MNKSTAIAPGAEHIGEEVSDFPAPRCNSLTTMTPLRGLAMNREQAMNAHPPASQNIGEINESGSGSTINRLRGLAKNREQAMDAHPTASHIEGEINESGSGSTMTRLRGLAKNREQAMMAAPTHASTRQNNNPSAPQNNELRPPSHLDDVTPEDVSQQDQVEEHGTPTTPSVLSGSPETTNPPTTIPTSPTAMGNADLTVAQEVHEDDVASPVMDAQEVDLEQLSRRKEHKRRKFNIIFGCAIVTIFCLVLALILGLKLGKKNQEQLPSSTTQSPTITMDSHVLSLLPSHTQESIAKDDSSPQAKAYDWLVADPNLTTYSDERIIQRFALGALFFATNGDAWTRNTHWMSYEVHECEWHAQDATKVVGFFSAASSRTELYFSTVIAPFLNASFPCADPVVEKQYTYLWLIANGLKGQLPPEVYLLTSLRHIALSINSLTGSALSTEIGKLSSLGGLDLSFNRFSGTIPTEIGLLSRLMGLGVTSNKFSGTLPSQLGQLSDNLMFVDLNDNLLIGSIPPSLGSLEKMISLIFYDNQLSGTIPTCLGRLSEMKWLYLGANELLGTIPTQLGLLGSLEALRLNQNSLTGSVPWEIGKLVLNGSLESFHIHTNNLTGTLPTDDLCLIDTVSNYDSQLIGCNCTCSYQRNGFQLCSPLPHHCKRL